MSIYTLVKEGTFIATHPTGSKYICNPPVLDTDEDYACLVENLEKFHVNIVQEGWEECEEGFYTTGILWKAYRKDKFNIIVTDSTLWYDRFLFTTEIAKKLNLKIKLDRVKLFELIRTFPYS